MADKIIAVVRTKIGRVIGSLEPERLDKLTTMVTAMIGADDVE